MTAAADTGRAFGAVRPGRYAAIDIGTVTCRLLVADVTADGRLHELAKGYKITNLGEGVDATGVLKAEAMQRVAAAVGQFQQTIASLATPQCPRIPTTAVATSASRDARNAGEFAALLAGLGLTLAVIPGEREAQLSFLGASCGFEGEQVIVVDVGGGSTELVAGTAGRAPLRMRSFNVGCRRATEKFLPSDPPAGEEVSRARAWVRDTLAPFFSDLRETGFSPQRLIAVAGTATSVVSVHEGMAVYDSARVHRYVVSREALDGVRRCLASLPLAERRGVAGLDPGRAPVIVAGLVILEEVLDLAGCGSFTASESDILQGIILDAATK